jgi:hypothetical protein
MMSGRGSRHRFLSLFPQWNTIVSRKTKPLQSCRQLPVFVAISTGQKLPKAKPVPSQEPQRPDGAPWSLLVRTTTACIHYKKLFNL